MEMRKLLDLIESKSRTVRTLDSITDEELESAIDGTTDLDMVRDLAQQCATQPNGSVDVDDFADLFAYRISGFIDADPDTDEWMQADEVNREWGESIADGINQLLAGE